MLDENNDMAFGGNLNNSGIGFSVFFVGETKELNI